MPENGRGGSRRRGLPLLPSVLVLLALPILIGLGLWQLQRMHWKEALLADMHAASGMPALVLDSSPIPHSAAFRQVRAMLDCAPQIPRGEAGRNLAGETGWVAVLACRAPAGEHVDVVQGWSGRADGWHRVAGGRRTEEGLIAPGNKGGWRLTATQAAPPLVQAAPPSPAEIPNNHFGYAIQWFAFAATLLAIYLAYVWRWRLATAPGRP